MIKFLKKSFLFCVVIILVILIFQVLISLRIKNIAVSGYDNWDVTSNVDADLVLLGSSRCWVQLDPRFFEKNYNVTTVNIGTNGHSELEAIILRLKNYLSKNKSPKFAILSFDPFVHGKKINAISDKNCYARFTFLPTKNNSDLVNYFAFNNYEKYIPLYAIFKYQQLYDCISLKNKDIFKEGFELVDKKWDTIKYPPNDNLKKYFIKKHEISSLLVNLENLKSICKLYKIKLLCLQTPVYKSLYIQNNFDFSKTICDSLKIDFINATYDDITKDYNCFYNSNHLNKYGINRFNSLLKQENQLSTFF